jgi:hypothetical protein
LIAGSNGGRKYLIGLLVDLRSNSNNKIFSKLRILKILKIAKT